jgi:RES domain-containing protein
MDGSDMIFTEVEGIFYRAIDPEYRAYALSGSRSPGRYSNSTQPTLYLSSSREGVDAAMHSHKGHRSSQLEVIRVRVVAKKIVDLRNSLALAAMGVSIDDAIAPWQELVARGATPRSWAVRDRLVDCGAHGLIDPSRKAPGLWHLVLFSWNQNDAPQVHLVDES